MNHTHQILEKIKSNTEVVGIIGLGYVGLPLAVNFAEAGIKVIGFDKSQEKVNKINSGENYIKDIRDAVLREVVDKITLFNYDELKAYGTCNEKAYYEKFEDIEILCFFDLNKKIKMVETKASSLAVDVPEDIIPVERALYKQSN